MCTCAAQSSRRFWNHPDPPGSSESIVPLDMCPGNAAAAGDGAEGGCGDVPQVNYAPWMCGYAQRRSFYCSGRFCSATPTPCWVPGPDCAWGRRALTCVRFIERLVCAANYQLRACGMSPPRSSAMCGEGVAVQRCTSPRWVACPGELRAAVRCSILPGVTTRLVVPDSLRAVSCWGR